MKKKIVKFSSFPIIAALAFLSFSTKEAVADLDPLPLEYVVPVIGEEVIIPDAPENYINTPEFRPYPRLGKSYLAFKDAVGFKESGGDYQAVNDFGYLGKYQFGKGTLKLIGIYDVNKFLDTPELQEAAFYANASRNKWILRKDIARSVGKVINGVKITESGILAAAHLAGPGNVKKYLRSGGTESFNDGFGTSIKYYFKKFANYDTSFVQPDRRARVAVN